MLSAPKEVTNEPCGCKRAHRLHWLKEPCLFVEDTQEYWSVWCYIEFLTIKLSNYMGQEHEINEATRQLEVDVRQLNNRIGHVEKQVAHWKQMYLEYASHKSDCNVAEMAASGRDIAVKCTCGYTDRINSIPESSNGRTSVSEADYGGSNPSSGTKRKKDK